MTKVVGDYGLRMMEEADLTLTWKWRNDASVRDVSANNKFIEWEEHQRWFLFGSPHTEKLIFTESGRALGVVTRNKKTGYWSFYLDPELPRRKGYGLIMLSLAVSWAKRQGTQDLKAQVLKTNPASLHLHQQLGFQIVGSNEEAYELAYI